LMASSRDQRDDLLREHYGIESGEQPG
jgi:hypothetical protein